MRISDWSSDVCSSDLKRGDVVGAAVDQQEHVPAELRAHRGLGVLAGLQRQVGLGKGRRHAAGMEVAEIAAARRRGPLRQLGRQGNERSEEHTSELKSLMRNSYAVFCLKKKKRNSNIISSNTEDRDKTDQAQTTSLTVY